MISDGPPVEVVWRSEPLFRPILSTGDPTTIAVIDDARLAARLVAAADDFEVVDAEALPDVVVLDIAQADDPVAVIRELRAVSPNTRVVMLTASDEAADLYRSLRAGASAYVVKQSDVTEIIDTVRAVCRGHLVIPSHLAGSMLADLERAEPPLSDTDREILAGIARGETNRELATRLHLSERTLRRRVEDLYAKVHLADRIEAAVAAARLQRKRR